MTILTMCKFGEINEFIVNLFHFSNRNYDDDFEDEDEGGVVEQAITKRMGIGGGVGSVLSPPQRLGSNKTNDIDERWKD